MAMLLTLSLELSSLRLVEFSNTNGCLLTRHEEKYFFSQEVSHQQILIQEVKEALQKIKTLWGLSTAPLHCILSSEFGLLRVITFEKSSWFVPITKLIQDDVEQFIPLPLEKISLFYQEIDKKKWKGSKTVAYTAIKTDFLEGIVSVIQESGFLIQKISLLPFALCSLPSPKETLMIELTNLSINFILLSSDNILIKNLFYPFLNFKNSFFEEETGLPLLLVARLKKELSAFINTKNFSGQCLMTKTYSSEKTATMLARFLNKEFSIAPITLDPCVLLYPTSKTSYIRKLLNKIQLSSLHYLYGKIPTLKLSWKRLFKLKQSNIIPIDKATVPSLAQFQRRQQIILFIYAIAALVVLFSPLIIFQNYLESIKITKETEISAICLKKRQFELIKIRQEAKELLDDEAVEKNLTDLQIAHNRWPLLLNELQQYIPRGIWITQLTPVIKKTKERKGVSEITILEIKGLYLQGINGEELIHEYAHQLTTSSLFLIPKEVFSFFSYFKEDGTAYAYPFTLQLQLPLSI